MSILNRLSHSSMSTYSDCPKKWEYRYKRRLYPKTTHAALLFGTAIDKAIETLLVSKDIEAATKSFKILWTEQEINNVPTMLPKCPLIVYANTDYDRDLLKGVKLDLGKVEQIIERKSKVGFEKLSDDEKMTLNEACWHCLRFKGLLMIDAFAKYIMPNIVEVLGTQVQIDLVNEEGDTAIGFVDCVLRWKGYEKPIIFDLKTSARQYEENAVITSPQLSLYTYALGETYNTNYAGYIVLNKVVRKNKKKVCSKCGFVGTGTSFRTCNNEIEGKRCGAAWNEEIDPEIFTQVLINEIPERLSEIVLENTNLINACIKNNIFPRSLTSCDATYGKCPYYDLCYKNSEEGLIQKVDKPK